MRIIWGCSLPGSQLLHLGCNGPTVTTKFKIVKETVLYKRTIDGTILFLSSQFIPVARWKDERTAFFMLCLSCQPQPGDVEDILAKADWRDGYEGIDSWAAWVNGRTEPRTKTILYLGHYFRVN